MSTLTKVLIILLTIFSIFLCGMVVTYVANADSYKKVADDSRLRMQRAERNSESEKEDFDKAKTAYNDQLQAMDKQITELKDAVKSLEGKLNELKTERDQLAQRVVSMASTVETANQNASNQTKMFEEADKDRQKLLAEQVRQGKELDEKTRALIDKMAVIAQLQTEKKQLVEEKQGLLEKLNAALRQYGKVIMPGTPVTPGTGAAKPAGAAPVTKELALQGKVTAVDMKNSLAEISIGSANGVRSDMKFHVVRGDRFICDILILDVDPDKAVGTLDRVQESPRTGDGVTTNL